MAKKMIASMQEVMTQYPTTFSQWLIAADIAIGPTSEIAILGSLDDLQTESLLAVLWETYLPRTIIAISEYPPTDGSPKLLEDRLLRNGQPTAYVCHDFACLKPVNSAADFREQLNNSLQKDN
ncbi:MAG TPA: hypothetical protein G4N95_03375 [Anaerolineae bacterium]|nr:hypothetical protein [Anaerolineae bacterium]